MQLTHSRYDFSEKYLLNQLNHVVYGDACHDQQLTANP